MATAAFTGLGKDGMLCIDEQFDCRETDLVPAEADNWESETRDGKSCSWKAVHTDSVGELGVRDARSV